MTEDRLAAIEARHRPCEPEVHDRDWLAKVAGKVRRERPDVPITTMREPAHCDHCGDPWPCDTAIVLARLHEVEQERDAAVVKAAAERRQFGLSSKNLLAERDAARAVLAAAHSAIHSGEPCGSMHDGIEAAVAAHEAAK